MQLSYYKRKSVPERWVVDSSAPEWVLAEPKRVGQWNRSSDHLPSEPNSVVLCLMWVNLSRSDPLWAKDRSSSRRSTSWLTIRWLIDVTGFGGFGSVCVTLSLSNSPILFSLPLCLSVWFEAYFCICFTTRNPISCKFFRPFICCIKSWVCDAFRVFKH